MIGVHGNGLTVSDFLSLILPFRDSIYECDQL